MNTALHEYLKVLRWGLVAAALAALPGLASANALLCSTGNAIGGIAVKDVTFEGSNADDCWGVGNAGEESASPWANGSWSLLVSDPNPNDATGASGSAGGVDFTLTASGNQSGTWQLGWKDTGATDLPFTMDLAVVLSTTTGFASYLFDNRLFQMDGAGAGAFALTFTTAPLGYFAIYQSNLTSMPTRGPLAVPEPSVLALFGIALVGAAASRARKPRRKQY